MGPVVVNLGWNKFDEPDESQVRRMMLCKHVKNLGKVRFCFPSAMTGISWALCASAMLDLI